MSRQKDFEIMQELQPLETLFNQLGDEKMALYIKMLFPFDIGIIRKAVAKVIASWDKVSIPPVGAIVAMCRLCGESGGTKIAGPTVGEKNQKERTDLVNQYVDSFRHSKLMQTAQAEGWGYQLSQYVREVANIQAQIIIPWGHGGIGLSWCKIQIDGLEKSRMDSWQREFLGEMRRLVGIAGNSIRVEVPDLKIEQFRQMARRAAAIAQTETGKGHISESMQKAVGGNIPPDMPTRDSEMEPDYAF